MVVSLPGLSVRSKPKIPSGSVITLIAWLREGRVDAVVSAAEGASDYV